MRVANLCSVAHGALWWWGGGSWESVSSGLAESSTQDGGPIGLSPVQPTLGHTKMFLFLSWLSATLKSEKETTRASSVFGAAC